MLRTHLGASTLLPDSCVFICGTPCCPHVRTSLSKKAAMVGPAPSWEESSFNFLSQLFNWNVSSLLYRAWGPVRVPDAWSSWRGWEEGLCLLLWQHPAEIMNLFHLQAISRWINLLTHSFSPASSCLPTAFCHLSSSPLNLRHSPCWEPPTPAIYIATDATMANFLTFLLDQQLYILISYHWNVFVLGQLCPAFGLQVIICPRKAVNVVQHVYR